MLVRVNVSGGREVYINTQNIVSIEKLGDQGLWNVFLIPVKNDERTNHYTIETNQLQYLVK